MKHVFLWLMVFSTTLIFAQDGPVSTGSLVGFDAGSWVKENISIPPSPEAAAFGRYGEIPVNFYTGNPNISIPLTSVGGSYISMPVSLSYDPSSVKVSSIPTWVGLGWNLNTGGMISKTVRGLPDNYFNFFRYATQDINIPGMGSRPITEFLTSYKSDIIDHEIMKKVTDGEIEIQPDVYNYNIPGLGGGTFVINRNKKIIFKEHTDLEFNLTWGENNNDQVVKFEVVTPRGYVYVFDKYESTQVEVEPNDVDGVSNPIAGNYICASAWYLTEIKTVAQPSRGFDIIELEYTDIGNYEQPFNQLLGESKTNTVNGYNCDFNISNTNVNPASFSKTTILNRKLLKSITYHKGGRSIERLVFHSTPTYGFYQGDARSSGHKLDYIEVEKRWKSFGWESTRFFVFNYGAGDGMYSEGRLTLLSVQEKGYEEDGITLNEKPAYSFSYGNGTLPACIDAGQDTWGYYNSSGIGCNLPSPSYLPASTASAATPVVSSRLPGHSTAGVLTSINYPTGGSTTFFYEPHVVEIADGVPSPYMPGGRVGGLRLQKIVDHPGVGDPITRTFNYVKGDDSEESSGKMLQKTVTYVVSSFFSFECPFQGWFPQIDCGEYKCEQRAVFAQNQEDPRAMAGNHVGYSRVEEILGTAESNIGKNIYHFKNEYLPGGFWENSNGTLLKTEVLDANNQIVRETDYNYTFYTGGNCPGDRCSNAVVATTGRVRSDRNQSNAKMLCEYADGTKIWRVFATDELYYLPCDGSTNCVSRGFNQINRLDGAMTIRQLWKTLDSEVTTEYFYEGGMQTVQSNKTYRYDSDCLNQPTYTSITNSDGATYGTEYIFPGDGCIGVFRGLPLRVLKTNGGFIGGFRYEYEGDKVKNVYELFQNDNPATSSGTLRLSIGGFINGMPQNYTYMDFPTEHLTWIGRLLTKRKKGDWEWEYDYNEKRELISLEEIDDQVVTFKYDGLQRLTEKNQRNGNLVTEYMYNYGAPNEMTEIVTPSIGPAQTMQKQFDGLGRPVKELLNGLVKKEYYYDQFNRLDQETYLPGNLTTHQYDESPLKRLELSILPDFSTLETKHGAQNNHYKTTSFDANGSPTVVLTDILGRKTEVIDAEGGSTTYEYESRGHLETVTPPSGSSYTYEYDDRNRLISKKIPGQDIEHVYAYSNATDLLRSSVDPNGQLLTYQYDDYGREERIYLKDLGPNYNPNTPIPISDFGTLIIENIYGESTSNKINYGKIISQNVALITENGAGGLINTDYKYDQYGRVDLEYQDIPMSDRVGRDIFDYTYNQLDWVLRENRTHDGRNNLSNVSTSHIYDNFGRETARFLGSNFEGAMGIGMTYNDRDQMTSKKLGGIGNSYLDRVDYVYNEDRGWLLNMNEFIMSVDDVDKLCEPSTPSDGVRQVQVPVTFQELLERISKGEDVTLPEHDPCTGPATCFEEINSVSIGIPGINCVDDISSNFGLIDLLNAPYCFSEDGQIELFISDLENKLNEMEILFGAVNVSENANNYTITISNTELSVDEVSVDCRENFTFFYLESPTSQITEPIVHEVLIDGIPLALPQDKYCKPLTKPNFIEDLVDALALQGYDGIPNRSKIEIYDGRFIIGYGYHLGLSLTNAYPITIKFNGDCHSTLGIKDLTFDRLSVIPCMASIENGRGGLIPCTTTDSPATPPQSPKGVTLVQIDKAGDLNPIWLKEQDLIRLKDPYNVRYRYYIHDSKTTFPVLTGKGQELLVGVQEFLDLSKLDPKVFPVKPTTGDSIAEECQTPLGVCSDEMTTLQNESIAQVLNEMGNIRMEDIVFPAELHLIRLCDGTTMYVLKELLDDIEGYIYPIDVVEIADPNQSFTITVTVKTPLFAMSFTHEPNGNIEQAKWKITDHTVKYYDYTYDALNRIKSASYGQEALVEIINNGNTRYEVIGGISNEYKVSGISYDAIGNITGLNRNGLVPYGECFDVKEIDKLSYGYSNDRLQMVTDGAEPEYAPQGFKPRTGSSQPYEYDKAGNMTYDWHKQLTITYNHLNLPAKASGLGGDVQWVYDALGRKWQKSGGDGAKEYCLGIEYEDQKLEAIYDADGRIVPVWDEFGASITEMRGEYWHKDHLGNVRLAFSDFNKNDVIEYADDPDTPEDETEITQENHYYPFGMNQTGDWYANISPENRYQYNRKGLDTDLGLNWYHYGARYYDPAIGRWGQIDPLAEEYSSYSPYNYTLNNPIKFVDPDGMRVSLFEGMAGQVGMTDDGMQMMTGEYRSEEEKSGQDQNSNSLVTVYQDGTVRFGPIVQEGTGENVKNSYFTTTDDFDKIIDKIVKESSVSYVSILIELGVVERWVEPYDANHFNEIIRDELAKAVMPGRLAGHEWEEHYSKMMLREIKARGFQEGVRVPIFDFSHIFNVKKTAEDYFNRMIGKKYIDKISIQPIFQVESYFSITPRL